MSCQRKNNVTDSYYNTNNYNYYFENSNVKFENEITSLLYICFKKNIWITCYEELHN